MPVPALIFGTFPLPPQPMSNQTMRRLFTSYFVVICIMSSFILNDGLRTSLAQEISSKETEQFDFANGLFQRDLYDMALAEYKKYIEAFNEGQYSDEAYFGIAECLFFSESYREAGTAYQDYLARFKEGKQLALATLRLGQATFFVDNFDQALETLQSVKQESLAEPFVHSLHFYLGRTYHRKGNNDEAKKYLIMVTQNEKQKKYLTQSTILLGDISQEETKYEEAVQQYDKAYTTTDDPQLKALALYKKAESTFKMENYQEAAAIFKDVFVNYTQEAIAAGALVNLLLSHTNLGQYSEVTKEFQEHQKMLEGKPNIFDAYYISANAYREVSQFDQALATLDQGLGLSSITDEDKNIAQIKKGEILVKSGRFQETIDFLKKLGDSNQQNGDQMMFLTAESHYGLKQYKEAVALYQKIITEFPQSALCDDARWAVALTQRMMGEETEALSSFVQYFEVGTNESNRQDALYNAILLETKLGQQEKAIEHAQTYINTFPQRESSEKVLYLLGQLYKKQQQYDQAIAVFQGYVSQFSESERLPEVYLLLGYCQQTLGKVDEALNSYQNIKEQSANQFYYSGLKNSAMIYISQDQDEQALEMLTQIIENFDEHDLSVSPYLWVLKNYLEKQQYEKVLSLLKKKRPEDLTTKDQAAFAYFEAEGYYHLGHFEKALEQYEAAISLDTEGGYYWLAQIGKASALKAMGSNKEASDILTKIIEENPTDHGLVLRARLGLGEIEETKGNFEGAIKYYMLVSVLYEDPQLVPQALFKAGELLEKQNKKQEALKAFQEIIKKYEENSLSHQAAQRVEILTKE